MIARSGLALVLPALLASLLTLGGCMGGGDDASRAAPAAPSSTGPVAAPATADDLARIRAAKTVRIGVKADSPPFGRKLGGQYVGFDIDIAQALAKQLGIEQVDFVPVTSANRIVKLLHGDCDLVIATMTITRYRERKIDFAYPPYFQDGEALLVKKDSPIHTYLDLKGRKVGCAQGSDSSYYMKQVAPDSLVVPYPGFHEMMAALDDGSVDAVTSDLMILTGLVKQAKDPGAYQIAGSRFTTEPYGIAVRQNQSHLRNALSDALQRLWEQGRYQSIADSWFGAGSEYQMPLNYAITPMPH